MHLFTQDIRRVSVTNETEIIVLFPSLFTGDRLCSPSGYGSFSSLHPVASRKAERTWCRACRLCVFKRIRQLAKSPFCEKNTAHSYVKHSSKSIPKVFYYRENGCPFREGSNFIFCHKR